MHQIIKVLTALTLILCKSTCTDLKDFEDSVLYKIDWPGDVDTTFDPEKFEPLIVTTNDQERYKCMIPHPRNKDEERAVDINITPLHFISTIFSTSTCSYRIEAYWAYEICHGHHVKQYHEERDGNKNNVDTHWILPFISTGKNIKVQEYYLGRWDAEKLETLKEKLQDDFLSGRKFKYTKIDNVKYPYMEMEMSDGTVCDLNNEPRVTRVRYVCFPHGKNEIYSLKEVSTCNYEAVVLTSVLCLHPAFYPKDSDENAISCLPIDDAPEIPLSWLYNEIENMKIRHKQISEVFSSKENFAIIKVDPQEVFSSKENFAIIKVDPQDGSLRMEFLPADVERKYFEEAVTKHLESTLANSKKNLESFEETPANDLPTVKDTTPVIQFLEGKNCLTGGTGWWKYEFCYGRYVRQFHVDKNGETSLVLGFFKENLHKEWLNENPEKRPKRKNIRTDISHLYQGGTMCDKTGEKRQTEVKLKCLENVSSPSSVSMYLLEPKTCQYILVIESPLICDILQKADDDGLVPKMSHDEDRDTKTVESVYIGNVQVEDVEVRYEND